jgi:hypothetical protein
MWEGRGWKREGGCGHGEGKRGKGVGRGQTHSTDIKVPYIFVQPEGRDASKVSTSRNDGWCRNTKHAAFDAPPFRIHSKLLF